MKKITICGSMAFLPEIKQIQQQLEEWGFSVVVPWLSETEAQTGIDKPWLCNQSMSLYSIEHAIWNEKAQLMREYFEEVATADAILVVNLEKHNVPGYIGGNVLMEMAIALYHNVPIYVLHPPNARLSYAEEIYGAQPHILHNDLLPLKELMHSADSTIAPRAHDLGSNFMNF